MSFFLPISDDFNAGLFQLLNEIETQQNKSANHCPAFVAPAQFRQKARQCQPRRATIHPNWDVRETENAYELYGELPGVERENLNIEFPGHETIVISGHVERNYGPAPTNEITAPATAPAAESTVDESKNVAEESAPVATEPEGKKSRRSSHQATVEDDPEDENNSRPSTPGSSWSEEITPAVVPQQEQAKKQQQQKPQQAQHKYWVRERSIGQFRRVFNFASRIDEDAVTANLNNGILSIVVPKAKLTAPRKIVIF
ncbi:HSP20-like chaperone [Dichotomopilus funicola]|uniref:HSP20-like chaperone n=1 Tax=Dichotomopilus funicola TaxID=1934379 RepID=A0AAN6V1I4_9PEZI|nr:HSP20-like chaperone [Dichotomopilus funicola]